MRSIGQTIYDYESSVDVNAERADSNTEDEAAIAVLEVPTPSDDETNQAQEITKTEHFGLIVGANERNGHISYASNEKVVEFVHILLNKRLQEPFMDITPNPSQELQVDDNNQMDDKNSNANKKYKSTIEEVILP